jgi:hypothetical protein
MKDRDGKILRLTDAQVEVEFVVNTDGTIWGRQQVTQLSADVGKPQRGQRGSAAMTRKSVISFATNVLFAIAVYTLFTEAC